MASPRVLVVAATHGNEINAPWLLDQWQQHPDLIDACDLEVVTVIGNPAAREQGRRYLDRDLNRSFRPDLLAVAAAGTSAVDREMARAHSLVNQFGPEAPESCAVALDLHSTTAAMGSSLVVYGRRPCSRAAGLPITVTTSRSQASMRSGCCCHWSSSQGALISLPWVAATTKTRGLAMHPLPRTPDWH